MGQDKDCKKGSTHCIDVCIDLKYTNKEHLTVDEIVAALQSAESLLYRTKPFIEASCDGYVLKDIQIYVESVESGSLLESFITKLVFETKENQQKAKEGFDQFIENVNMKGVIMLGLGALAGAGVGWAYVAKNPNNTATHIEAYNSQVINFGDNAVLSEKTVKDILAKMTNKKQIAKDATRFVSPAKKDASATIEIGAAGEEKIIINSKVIAEAPKKYEPPQPTEKSVSYDGVIIKVVALNIYQPTKWLGEIEGVADSPVKLIFADDIDVTKLSRTAITADIEVKSKFNKNKRQYKPIEIFVNKLVE